jgi:acetolactate synthase-1/2/3 large subunit
VGTDLRFVRYDKVVEAIGGYGEYVEKPEEVGPAVERAFNSGLPSLVNIVVKPGASPLADAMIARRTGR